MAKATFQDCRRLVRGASQLLPLLQWEPVNGIAVGRKRVQGEETEDLAIIVYVSKKLGLERLPLLNRIPSTVSIPDAQASGGVLEFITDVQEARFGALPLTDRMRPARSGISVGHRDTTAGTLGGLLRDGETGDVVILSNNHVLANSNDADLGDAILQPGPADGGVDPDDRIAQLSGFVAIDFSDGAENRVDAAIATPIDAGDLLFDTVDIGAATPGETHSVEEADLGRFVHKTGRTTSHTQGFVQAVFGTVRVDYDLFRTATFVDQIIVSQSPAEEDFSDGGDSGSLVYDAENRCVGLLFAGSQASEGEPARTIVNPIDAVLNSLGLELLAPGEHPSGEAAPAPGGGK
ncbi:MAG: chymotrypsin family serine protease [Planctomycetota bacterium]|jgi:hypothetical protein